MHKVYRAKIAGLPDTHPSHVAQPMFGIHRNATTASLDALWQPQIQKGQVAYALRSGAGQGQAIELRSELQTR